MVMIRYICGWERDFPAELLPKLPGLVPWVPPCRCLNLTEIEALDLSHRIELSPDLHYSASELSSALRLAAASTYCPAAQIDDSTDAQLLGTNWQSLEVVLALQTYLLSRGSLFRSASIIVLGAVISAGNGRMVHATTDFAADTKYFGSLSETAGLRCVSQGRQGQLIVTPAPLAFGEIVETAGWAFGEPTLENARNIVQSVVRGEIFSGRVSLSAAEHLSGTVDGKPALYAQRL